MISLNTVLLATFYTLIIFAAGLFSGWYISRKARQDFKIDIEDIMRGYTPVQPTENEKILESGKPRQPNGPPPKHKEYIPTQGRGNFKTSLSS